MKTYIGIAIFAVWTNQTYHHQSQKAQKKRNARKGAFIHQSLTTAMNKKEPEDKRVPLYVLVAPATAQKLKQLVNKSDEARNSEGRIIDHAINRLKLRK